MPKPIDARLIVRATRVEWEPAGGTRLIFDCGDGRLCCAVLSPKRADWLLGAMEKWSRLHPEAEATDDVAPATRDNSIGLVDRFQFRDAKDGAVIVMYAVKTGAALAVGMASGQAAALTQQLRAAHPLWTRWSLNSDRSPRH